VTVNKIKVRVTADDDATTIRCKAEHPAMIDGEIYHHLQAAANITVLCKSTLEYLETVGYPASPVLGIVSHRITTDLELKPRTESLNILFWVLF
jgi:hypothetical protein